MSDDTTTSEIPLAEKRKLLFVQLATSFQQAAWTGLGKIQGPDGKITVDLEAASAYIDLLDMLRNYTQGNLDDELAKLLDKLIGDLKLNYLEESGKEQPDQPDTDAAAAEAGEAEAAADDAAADSRT